MQICSQVVPCNSCLHVYQYYASESTLAANLSGTLSANGSCHKRSPYVTGFAKRGLIRTIINTEKFHFEILITVYLKNAWCLVYELLHQSIVIPGNSAGALFDGLLAEMPAILDSFFHQCHK